MSTAVREHTFDPITSVCAYCNGVRQLVLDQPCTVVVSVFVLNSYEDGAEVTTRSENLVLPAPVDPADLEEWADEHLFPLTGTGRSDGEAVYELTISSSSDPALAGKTFEWGL